MTDTAGEAPDRSAPWGLAASLLLHATAVALLLSIAPVRLAEPPHEVGIAVEIVTAPPPATERSDAPVAAAPAPNAPPLGPLVADTPAPAPGPTSPALSPPRMIKPTRMLSGKELDAPRNRAARQALSQTAPEDRAIQLCAFEAMAQVAAWNAAFRPDLVVAYAMADVVFAGDTLVADGGAIHSRGKWFDIRFRCVLQPDPARVTAFEFRVGDAIPKRKWAAHGLAGEEGPLD